MLGESARTVQRRIPQEGLRLLCMVTAICPGKSLRSAQVFGMPMPCHSVEGSLRTTSTAVSASDSLTMVMLRIRSSATANRSSFNHMTPSK